MRHLNLNQLDRHDLVATIRELETDINQLEGTINDLKEELDHGRHCVCNHTWDCVRRAGSPAVASRETEE